MTPATRTIRNIATEARSSETTGWPDEYVLSPDNIGLIRTAGCSEQITVLPADILERVCAALRFRDRLMSRRRHPVCANASQDR